jgi:hypothetical protein
MFERAIKNITNLLRDHSLEFLVDGVKWYQIDGETTGSGYSLYGDVIYLHPRDVKAPLSYGNGVVRCLILHEVGHRFAQKILRRNRMWNEDVVKLFGNCYRAYKRKIKQAKKAEKSDLINFVSRYSLTHPAEDFSETFCVCLDYLLKDKSPILLVKQHKKSKLCEKKIRKMIALLNEKIIDKKYKINF